MNQRLVLIVIFLLVILILRFASVFNKPSYQEGETVQFTTRLLKDPTLSGRSQRFQAVPNGKDTVMVMANRFPTFHYGQKLTISGKISIKSQPSVNETIGERTLYSVMSPQISVVRETGPVAWLFTTLYGIRQSITHLYTSSLPQPQAGLLLGIVFGIKTNLPDDFYNSLKNVGLLHVIAASGMNVTMVAAFLMRVTSSFCKRQVALGWSITGIMLYALFAGLDPSILRAAIMGSLVFASQIIGRQSMTLWILSLTASGMLLVSPRLLFDVGFQLSFAATTGLILLPQLFEKSNKLSRMLKRSLIGEDILTTIAAQIATVPIILYYFGSYSLWSIFVNGIVLWIVPIVMVVGIVAVSLGFVFPLLGTVLLLCCLPFLLFFSFIANFFGRNEGIMLTSFPWQFVIGYYLFLGAIVLIHQKKQQKT